VTGSRPRSAAHRQPDDQSSSEELAQRRGTRWRRRSTSVHRRPSHHAAVYQAQTRPTNHGQFISYDSKQRLFIHDLLFVDHFTVSGDMRRC